MQIPKKNSSSQRIREYLLFLGITFSSFSNIWGITSINWGLTREIFKVLFIIISIFIFANLGVTLFLLYSRCKNILYPSNILYIIPLSKYAFFLSTFSIFLLIFSFYYVFTDFNKKQIYLQKKFPRRANLMHESFQWGVMCLSYFLTFFFLTVVFFSWISIIREMNVKKKFKNYYNSDEKDYDTVKLKVENK